MTAFKQKAPITTERHEVQLRWKKYRVFVHDGKIVRIDSINPAVGEKNVYRRVALNGRVAAHVAAHFRKLQPIEAPDANQHPG